MRDLPRSAQIYVLAVIATGVLLLCVAVTRADHWLSILAFAVLFVACDSIPVATGVNERWMVSVAQPVGLAACVVVGPWGAALVAAATIFDLSPITPVKRLFNATQFALSTFVCGAVYVALGGPSYLTPSSFPAVLFQILAASIAFGALNAGFVAVVLRLTEPTNRIVPEVVSRSTVPTLAFTAVGLMIAVVWQEVGPLALLLVLMPLFVARWAMGQFAAERDAYQATIAALVQAVETKDAYTRGHSERVARASVMIARRLAMKEDRVNAIEYAGTLHDVGKLGVPTGVLTKAGKLTDEEFDAIKTHPVRGHEIVREIEFLDEALNGIYHHHERMDGRGYPAGLSGLDIPEFARVIAVADAFDSMTSTRSYRGARPVDEAVEELERCKGTQFDPVMVDAMVLAVAEDGWNAAVPPTADELAKQTTFSIDDDDPFIDMRSEVRP